MSDQFNKPTLNNAGALALAGIHLLVDRLALPVGQSVTLEGQGFTATITGAAANDSNG